MSNLSTNSFCLNQKVNIKNYIVKSGNTMVVNRGTKVYVTKPFDLKVLKTDLKCLHRHLMKI